MELCIFFSHLVSTFEHLYQLPKTDEGSLIHTLHVNAEMLPEHSVRHDLLKLKNLCAKSENQSVRDKGVVRLVTVSMFGFKTEVGVVLETMLFLSTLKSYFSFKIYNKQQFAEQCRWTCHQIYYQAVMRHCCLSKWDPYMARSTWTPNHHAHIWPFQKHGDYHGAGPANNSFQSSGKAFNKIIKCACGDLCPFSNTSISEAPQV